ncbi:hypothetical protein FRC07_003843 [Ceratobasidium sp. 392]|nr:hypothetical protein FRC07_003843 [Ceratobasidium sp. 392]
MPFYLRVSDLGVDPAYMGPSLPHRIPEPARYPYLPHNPTSAELEACTSRMRSVRFRDPLEDHFGPRSGDSQPGISGGRTGRNSTLGNYQLNLSSPELADESDLSGNSLAEEESSGPATPLTPDTGFWRDGVQTAFVPPRAFQSAPNAPPSSPVASFVPAPSDKANCSSSRASGNSSNSGSTISSTDRAFAYAAIDGVIYEHNKCVLSFKMPTQLDFVAPKDGETVPQLPYTGPNKPFIHHRHELDGLLDRLDKIESHGDDKIRRMRKQAVEEVKQSLGELKRQQSMAWFNLLE